MNRTMNNLGLERQAIIYIPQSFFFFESKELLSSSENEDAYPCIRVLPDRPSVTELGVF